MPVVIGLSPVVIVPATLYLPGGEGVPYHEHKYHVHFRRVSPDEFQELQTSALTGKVKQAEVCDRVVIGWGGMLDEAGQPVPYTAEERRATEKVFKGLEESMAVAFFDTFDLHQRKAAEKNSEARSAITSAPTAQTVTSLTTN